MTASNVPRRGQSVNDLLSTSVAVFRATLLKCLPLAMIAVLCASVPSFYLLQVSGHSPDVAGKIPTDPVYWWLVTIALVLMLYLSSAMMLRQLYVSGGFAVNVRQELMTAARRLPALVLAWALMQLSLMVLAWVPMELGLAVGFPLIIPGVFLFICYLVLLPVVLLEGQLNPLQALLRCILLVRPNWWRVCTAFVIAVLAMLIVFLAFGAVMNILEALLAGLGQAFEAVAAAATIAVLAMVFVFFSAMALTIHSSANNSA
jgi:hypothetical protein